MDPPYLSARHFVHRKFLERDRRAVFHVADVRALPDVFGFFPGAASVRMEKCGDRDGDGYLEYGPGATIRG